MKFPLADWIDAYPDVRHNLASSGMRGEIQPPTPSAADVRGASEEDLRRALASLVEVDPRRVFLTHGATEANAGAFLFLRSRSVQPPRTCRVAFPEYPPLFDLARAAGFAVTDRPGPTGVAVVSQPRNPEGDLWSPDRLRAWAEGAQHLLVDETFREFAGTRSILSAGDDRVWATGSFTKFFAGDDLRVGFLVAPEPIASEYARFHGLVFDELPVHSVASALACLRERSAIRRAVERILRPNRAHWRRAFAGRAAPRGPVGFDLPVLPDGDDLAARCLAASVLVCPGSFFGDAHGVRLSLTRRTFARDLAAYLAVRDGPPRLTRVPPSRSRPHRGVRPRRAGIGRGRGGRG